MSILRKDSIFILSFLAASVIPRGANAAPQTFADLVDMLVGLLQSLVPVLIGLGLIYFLWGLASFILHAGDEQAIQEGKQRMLYGILGLVAMGAVWGLVSLIRSSIGI